MLRKNLFGDNLDYADVLDKSGNSIITVTPKTNTIKIVIPSLYLNKSVKYKNLNEINTFIQEPSIKAKIFEGAITERKNGIKRVYQVFNTQKGFEFHFAYNIPY